MHELVGNALVMKGEKERTADLRGEPSRQQKRRALGAEEEASHA